MKIIITIALVFLVAQIPESTNTVTVAPQPEIIAVEKIDTVAQLVDQPMQETYTKDCSLVKQDKYTWDKRIMYAVCWAESRNNPLAKNDNPRTKDYSIGLMQINLYGDLKYSRPSEEWLYNPENNIDYAYQIWNNQGYKGWGAYASGMYTKYLTLE